MSLADYLGLLANIPMLKSLRILEGAASLALLISPGKAKEFLNEIGVQPVEGEEEEIETIFNIRNLVR